MMVIEQLPSREELSDHFYGLLIDALPETHRIEDYFFGIQHTARVFADRIHNVRLFDDPFVQLTTEYDDIVSFVYGETRAWGEPVRFANNTLFYLALSNYPDVGPLGVWAAKVFTAQHRLNTHRTPGISGPAQLGEQLPEFVALARVARSRSDSLAVINQLSGFDLEALVVPPPPKYDLQTN